MLELGLDPSMEIWSLSRVWGRAIRTLCGGYVGVLMASMGLGFMASIKHDMMNGWSSQEARCKV